MPTANYGTPWWYNPYTTDIIPLSLLHKLAWQLSCHLCQQPGYHLCFLSVKLRIFFLSRHREMGAPYQHRRLLTKDFPLYAGLNSSSVSSQCSLHLLHTRNFFINLFLQKPPWTKVLWCATAVLPSRFSNALMNPKPHKPSVLRMKKILKQK